MSDDSPKNDGKIKSRTRSGAPAAGVWTRIGLLLGALCLVKVFLLLSLRKYLFEIHWRIGALAPSWLDEAAFYLFALLIGLNLWVLGVRCATIGIRTMRTTNFCVLGLGAAFIFLTLHAGDKNYLFPVMNGTLTWKNLGWYLAMDFCFHLPYLAAWILGYAFVYYFLARTGRELWMLRVTAVCAAAYTAICLRGLMVNHDLLSNRHALIAVDCVGIASFVASLAAGQRTLRLLWVCLPLILMGFFYALFISFDKMISHPLSEFILLEAVCVILFTGASVLTRRAGGYAAWSWGLPFAFSAFLILVNINYILAGNYCNLLTLGLALPRYFLGEFAVAALLFFVAFCYRLLMPKGSLWWLDAINLILIALALADLRLSQIMGVRLDWQLLEFGNSPKMMWRLSLPYLPAFFGMLAALITVYVIALLIIQKWRGRMAEAEKMPAKNGRLFALIVFLLLGLAGWSFAQRDKAEGQTAVLLVKTNPLWRKAVSPPMSLGKFTETARQLGIHLVATPDLASEPETAPRDLNVVVIFQESSYNKYLSLFDDTNDTEPLLSKYKNRMELFPNFFSNFAGSIWARFATFTGLYPVRDLKMFTQHHVPVKSIFEILHDHGYTCSLFYSSFIDYTGFRDFLNGRDLDAVYDADTMPGPRKFPPVDWGLREEVTLAAMQNQIKQYAADKKKFFLTYVPAAPHNPFDAVSDRFRTRKANNVKVGDLTPFYLNSLTYMDWIISSVIDQLKTSGLLNKTLIIITDDHGEMLGQNGGPVGHGWAVTPVLVNVPLIIMDPAKPGYSVNDVVGSQVDVLPTILNRLNIRLPGGQIYEGTSLDSPGPDTNRLIYLNSFQQYGIIQDHRLTCGDPEKQAAKISGTSYAISNKGARTFFTQTNAPDFSLPPISQFDDFQENFLANYAHYCQFLKP
jgi:Sulfatase